MTIATRQTNSVVNKVLSQHVRVHAAVSMHACVSKLSLTPAAALGKLL